MGEFAAAHLQRVRHISQRLFGVRLQMGGEFGTLFVERLGSPEAAEAFSAFFEKRAPDFSSFE